MTATSLSRGPSRGPSVLVIASSGICSPAVTVEESDRCLNSYIDRTATTTSNSNSNSNSLEVNTGVGGGVGGRRGSSSGGQGSTEDSQREREREREKESIKRYSTVQALKDQGQGQSGVDIVGCRRGHLLLSSR